MNGPFFPDSVLIPSSASLSVKLASQFPEQIVITFLGALLGGLFAAFFTSLFEWKNRISELRLNKYLEHRNTIIQIEQELIPVRLNNSRNITSLQDAIETSKLSKIRLILRFYDLSISSGLGMRLLSTDLINKYFDVYILVEGINSDIKYIKGVVDMIQQRVQYDKPIEPGLLETYKIISLELEKKLNEADEATLDLISICKLTFNEDNSKMRDKYVRDGKEIKYLIKPLSIQEKKASIKLEEKEIRLGEVHPKFVAPYLDLSRQ